MPKTKIWRVNGEDYIPSSSAAEIEDLPIGIYQIKQFMPGLYGLSKMAEQFHFPYKLYNTNDGFSERVVKTYHATTGNLGILLHGIQGTGKTVTMEQICNLLQQPVIIVEDNFGALPDFLANIEQDIIVACDEFEKTFDVRKEEGATLLAVMDGILKGQFRKTFILTSNSLAVSEFLLQRPGRIRYKKEFGNLDVEVIMEIVDDMLVHKNLRDKTVEFIAQLQLITIDIVTAVVTEVNIHEQDPSEFYNIFNVKRNASRYSVFIVPESGNHTVPEKQIGFNAKLNRQHFDSNNEGDRLYDHAGHNGAYGTIVEVIDAMTCMLIPDEKFDPAYQPPVQVEGMSDEDHEKLVEAYDDDYDAQPIMVRIEPVSVTNPAFKRYHGPAADAL